MANVIKLDGLRDDRYEPYYKPSGLYQFSVYNAVMVPLRRLFLVSDKTM